MTVTSAFTDFLRSFSNAALNTTLRIHLFHSFLGVPAPSFLLVMGMKDG